MEPDDVRIGDVREASFCKLWPDVKPEIPPILLNRAGLFSRHGMFG
jgi:hypothetical protein